MSLDFFEEYLESLDGGRKLLYALLLLVMVGGLFYFLLIEPALEDVEIKKKEHELLSKKIVMKSPQSYKATQKRLEKKIAFMREKIDRLHSKELALQTRLEELNTILLNEKNFPKLLEKILQLSSKYKIGLNQIEIEDKNKKYYEKIKIKKRMTITGDGQFLNIVKFVRGIEDDPVLLKVDRYIIETNGSVPGFELVVDFFGV